MKGQRQFTGDDTTEWLGRLQQRPFPHRHCTLLASDLSQINTSRVLTTASPLLHVTYTMLLASQRLGQRPLQQRPQLAAPCIGNKARPQWQSPLTRPAQSARPPCPQPAGLDSKPCVKTAAAAGAGAGAASAPAPSTGNSTFTQVGLCTQLGTWDAGVLVSLVGLLPRSNSCR